MDIHFYEPKPYVIYFMNLKQSEFEPYIHCCLSLKFEILNIPFSFSHPMQMKKIYKYFIAMALAIYALLYSSVFSCK